MNVGRRMGWLSSVLIAGAFVGCGASDGATENGVSDTTTIRAMSEMYTDYLRTHRNRAPKNEQEFRQFLTARQDELKPSGLSVEKMFLSPRNAMPLQWVYGKAPPTGPMGITFIGYETTPVEGKRLVLATRGMHELMDEEKFRSLFPNTR